MPRTIFFLSLASCVVHLTIFVVILYGFYNKILYFTFPLSICQVTNKSLYVRATRNINNGTQFAKRKKRILACDWEHIKQQVTYNLIKNRYSICLLLLPSNSCACFVAYSACFSHLLLKCLSLYTKMLIITLRAKDSTSLCVVLILQ